MEPGNMVCVTGAGGFIASWIVKMLLEQGYRVKGTVRDPERARHLLALPGASDRLQLLEADLLTPGAFDSIVEDCDGVFHTASPMPGGTPKMEADYLECAIKGTLNVLESCAKARPKRIVLTSSWLSVCQSPEITPDTVIDETFFSDADFVRKTESGEMASYTLGKTYAEEAAWNFVTKQDLDMVSMIPVMVTGPPLQSSLNETNEVPVGILAGTIKTLPNRVMPWVGVKDVAKAHILGYEKPEAEGRYIICERALHYGDLGALLQRLFPQFPIVAREDAAAPRVAVNAISTEKLKKLGLDVEPLEDVLRETVERFKELKYLV